MYCKSAFHPVGWMVGVTINFTSIPLRLETKLIIFVGKEENASHFVLNQIQLKIFALFTLSSLSLPFILVAIVTVREYYESIVKPFIIGSKAMR